MAAVANVLGLVFRFETDLDLQEPVIDANGPVADRIEPKGSVQMNFRNVATTVVAALSLIAMPTMASAQTVSASKLSVASSARSSAKVDSENLAGGSLIIAVLAAAAVIAGIYIAADSDDEPDSP